MNTTGNFSKIYIKFILAAGFLFVGSYNYWQSSTISLKAGCFMAVGIGYLIYGIYAYQKQRA